MLSRLNVCVGVILAVGLGGCAGTGKRAELPPQTGGPAPSVVTGDWMPLDPTRAERLADSDLSWYDARDLGIEGKGWADTENPYERLPARAEAMVPGAVWRLSKHTAGLCVRFVTDSKSIGATWDGGGAMNHMAATGNSGLDLYVRCGDGWVFRGVGRPQMSRTTAVLAGGLSGKPAEYLLYLPLYQKVSELRLGVEEGARIGPAAERPAERRLPIVFYGTSITQGGCASRAGMCHPAMVGRWLDRPVINLGFSGSGKMEPELATLLGELPAALFVLECLPNMTTSMVGERVAPFVLALRQAQPTTPILLVESPLGGPDNPGNMALRRVFAELDVEGVHALYFVRGGELLAGRENGTVDGVHPTDLGFSRMAEVLEPVLRDILEDGD